MEQYCARLEVKGYANKEGIDFNEILITFKVVLAIWAMFDLHLEQLDMKITFLCGDLEKEIYMLQPKSFNEKGKENLFCKLNEFLCNLK